METCGKGETFKLEAFGPVWVNWRVSVGTKSHRDRRSETDRIEQDSANLHPKSRAFTALYIDNSQGSATTVVTIVTVASCLVGNIVGSRQPHVVVQRTILLKAAP